MPKSTRLTIFEALLHPAGSAPINVASSVPIGRLMSFNPSQSTGSQSGWNTSNSKCCSLRALYTIIARPDFTNEQTRCQSLSRTRAERRPTNTPGAISRSQRVRSPRAPAGHAVSTMTTMSHHPLDSSAYCFPAATSPSFSSHSFRSSEYDSPASELVENRAVMSSTIRLIMDKS